MTLNLDGIKKVDDYRRQMSFPELGDEEYDTERGSSGRNTGRGLSKRTIIYVDKPELETKNA